MKLLGVDVPPNMLGWWEAYISANKNASGGVTQARTRRGARVVMSSRSARKIETELTWAAEYIARQLGLTPKSPQFRAFVAEEKQRLLDGVFDERFWEQCDLIENNYYSSAPTIQEDTNPPPYAYRDPTMKPAIVAYADGVEDVPPLRSSGGVISEQWEDILWVWRRSVFSLRTPADLKKISPIMWKSAGTISATATTRGSRPMLSTLMRAHIIADGSQYETDLSAPVQPATSFYWRYVMPETEPPYYNTTQPLKNIAMLNKRATKDGTGTLSKVIIKSSVRPMLGRGFNNNDSVYTEFSDTNELWQVIQPFPFTAEAQGGGETPNQWVYYTSTLNGKKLKSAYYFTYGGGGYDVWQKAIDKIIAPLATLEIQDFFSRGWYTFNPTILHRSFIGRFASTPITYTAQTRAYTWQTWEFNTADTTNPTSVPCTVKQYTQTIGKPLKVETIETINVDMLTHLYAVPYHYILTQT